MGEALPFRRKRISTLTTDFLKSFKVRWDPSFAISWFTAAEDVALEHKFFLPSAGSVLCLQSAQVISGTRENKPR